MRINLVTPFAEKDAVKALGARWDFFVLYVVISILWTPPLMLAAIYVGASVITFLAYALDKSAAERGSWRTPETTLQRHGTHNEQRRSGTRK
jgi:hypothetical protein